MTARSRRATDRGEEGTVEQEPLFQPLEPVQRTVRLDEVAPWSTKGARSPVEATISAFSMINPVTLQELPPGQQYRYKVLAGKRRLTATQKLGRESVRAVVFPAETGAIEGALVPLIENVLRRDNPLDEAHKIREFADAAIAAGLPQKDVKPYLTGLGFPASVIDQRLKLLELPPEIQQGIAQGKVKPSVAAKIANRSKVDQQVYVEQLQIAGKLSGKDVTNLRKVQVQQTLESLPDALFALSEDDSTFRAKWTLEALLAEGFSKSALLHMIHELPEADTAFQEAQAA